MTELNIKIAKSVDDAPNYRKLGGYKGAELLEAVIVPEGTESGAPSVDLVFEDEAGNKFVALTTGAILEGLAMAVAGVRAIGLLML